MNCSETLYSLLSDTLDFSKIEAGKLELDLISFDLRELVENVLNLTRINAEDKGLTLRLEIEPEVLSFLIGDPVRLRQIPLNFLINAIKFTERGGISVRIAVQEEKGEQLLLKMSVEDSGIGISLDMIKILSQSFSQADTSTSRKYEGTDLGLAICKRLSELMGGQVGVQSEAGAGSTFWCTVRLQKTSEDTLSRKKESAYFQKTLPFSPELLLVENNKFNKDLALFFLREFGLTADVAKNGIQGV